MAHSVLDHHGDLIPFFVQLTSRDSQSSSESGKRCRRFPGGLSLLLFYGPVAGIAAQIRPE
jgi:hypothetical protein